MSGQQNLTDRDKWLAAEYALGVLNRAGMKNAEKRIANDDAFRSDVEAWQSQLAPLVDEVDEVTPPKMVWDRIEQQVFEPPRSEVSSASDTSGFWKLVTAFTSTVAVACFGLLMFVTDGDFTGSGIEKTRAELAELKSREATNQSELKTALGDLSAASEKLAALEAEIEQQQGAFAAVNEELESATEAFRAAQQEVASLRSEILSSRPLVASLTQSGDAPAFVAQYDPLKKALLIRTAVEDSDEKVPEIWLIPAQGDRKGEVLSLGVMNEAAPDTLPVADDFVSLIGEGGTLAITMEPPGGAPNGVATGPVIALGKLQAF